MGSPFDPPDPFFRPEPPDYFPDYYDPDDPEDDFY